MPPFEREPEPLISHRTTARGTLLAFLALGLLAGPAAASPDPPFKPRRPAQETAAGPRLIFPIVGSAVLTRSFGDARSQGAHQGEDIMAPRKAPAVAVESGTVRFHATSSAAGCMLYLYGRSGTKYLYIHLNNDLTVRNDNRGRCVPGVAYAPDLESGDRVEAGELIGYVGDSGDANGIAPHLHFELHLKGRGAVDPYTSLLRARKLLFAARRGTTFTAALWGKVISADVESLSVRVSSVRTWPTRTTASKLNRPVTVTVPVTALVERIPRAGGLALPILLLSAREDETVVVSTEPAAVTLNAQLGRAGELVAQRVQLFPSP